MKYFNIRIVSVIIIVFFSISGYSQDYNYIHYTTKDGLAGNTVYGVVQDRDGYMFFATENGLSRFDGKEWKTFTVKDGLPDNEILTIFCDRKGRVWMGQFNKTLCYFYKGIIHNSKNDSLLKRISLNSIIVRIHEDENGEVFFSTLDEIFSIDTLPTINKLKSISKYSYCTRSKYGYYAHKNPFETGSIFYWGDSIFTYKNKVIKFIDNADYDSIFHLQSCSQNQQKFITNGNFNPSSFNTININSVDIFDKYVSSYNTNNGTYIISSSYILPPNGSIEHFLPNIKTGHTCFDKEGNYWFTTLKDGIYKLPSNAIKSYSIKSDFKNNQESEVYHITKNGNKILCGSNLGQLLFIQSTKISIVNFQKYIKFSNNTKDINRATSSLKVNPSTTIIGFDSYLLKLQDNQPSFNYNVMPVKSVEKIDDKNIIVATGNHCYKIRINDLKIVDTIWDDRTTYAFHQNNQNYIGTLTGLYVIGENKKQTFLGNLNAALTRRIVCIKSANDGTLYIATADNGIVALKNNKVFRVINDENGLSSNSCKTLHINNNFLWVGTINGITKIDLGRKNAIIKYSTSDGLPSNIINAIYVDDTDSTVWVGSPEGLTSFKEKDVVSKSICNLVMQKITVSGNNLSTDSNNFQLKYTDNNIRFQFAGISFRSADDITYFYKIKELDNTWRKTKERVLNYPTLESGNYSFLIYATNKYGVISKTIQINFNIATPFWKTWWFNTLLAMICIAAIYFFLKRRFYKAKKLQSEKALASQQLASMEQMALQAQMNPHFIFNCLNSIQQFILFGDIENANKYLTDFAILVRSTLDNSSLKNITVEGEVLYLKRYLELEQLRFGDSFTFEIVIDKSVDKGFTKMPAMLLQPLVENSLRHGIRPQKDKKGIVKISFFETDGYLVCSVWDNGIGRAASAKLKTDNHIQYQSKGMELTIKRIQLLNTEVTNKASVKVLDIKDDNNIVIGTEIILKLPLGKN